MLARAAYTAVAVTLASGFTAAAADAVTVNYWAGTGIDSHAPLSYEKAGSPHQLTRNSARTFGVSTDYVCVYATRNGVPDTATYCSYTLADSGSYAGTVTRSAHVYPDDPPPPSPPDTRAKYDY